MDLYLLANVMAQILGVRSFVDQALNIMDIAVHTSTSQGVWRGRISEIEENQSTFAGFVTEPVTHGNSIVEFFLFVHRVSKSILSGRAT